MSVDDLKTCTSCMRELPLDQFYWQTSRHGKRYPRGKCKSCEYVQGRQRIKANPAKTAYRQRMSAVKRRYNLTEGEFHDMLARQGGQCAICESSVGVAKSCVDHDHRCCPGENSCGKCVRGILCRSCNVGIGKFKENVEFVERAALYMKRELP